MGFKDVACFAQEIGEVQRVGLFLAAFKFLLTACHQAIETAAERHSLERPKMAEQCA